MAYIPKGNSAWLLRKAINRSDSAIADLETNLTTLARTASNTGTSTTTQVLFNDAGIVNGDAGLVYNKTTDALSVGGALGVTGTTTLTGAATVQGVIVGKGVGADFTNTVFGTNGLQVRTIATDCSIFGSGAGGSITAGVRNTLLGTNAGNILSIGAQNTSVGMGTLQLCVSGDYNTTCGEISLNVATGSDNTAIGARSLTVLTTGDGNTGCGRAAGGSQTSGSNNGFFGNGATGDSNIASNSYNYGNASVTSHKFRNGDVVVGNGNVVMSTIGKGIDFSATANSSGNLQTSELLADYEEGTWVPTDNSGAGLVLTVTECKYTKIGRAVTIQGSITYPVNANASQARITGLPFAFVGIAPLSIAYTDSIAGGVITVAYLMAHFAVPPLFYNSTGGGTPNSALSGGLIQFSGTYMI